MKPAMKDAVAGAADRLGLLRLPRGSSRNVVFALHQVLPENEVEHAYNRHLVLREDSFAAFLQFVLQHFEVVSLDEFVKRREDGRSTGMAALTFDDGWVDNYRYAFPLLREFHAPATIFLATGLIGTNWQLPEQRFTALWNMSEKRAALCARLESETGRRVRTFLECRQAFKSLPYEKKSEILQSGEKEQSGAARNFLGWDEVREMRETGIIRFGSHTQNHVVLSCETDDVITREIESSLQDLARETGESSKFLAYPNGGYDSRAARICDRLNIEAAFTTVNSFVEVQHPKLEIPRVAIDDSLVGNAKGLFSVPRTKMYLARLAQTGR